MTLIVTDVPQTIDGLLTESIAAVSQIPYFITFKDGDILSVVDSGGFAEFHFAAAAGDLTSRIDTGDNVYFADGATLADGFYEVTSSSFASSTTRVLTTTAFSATDTGIMTIKLRKGYHFQITVVDDETGVDINENALIYLPSQSGRSGLIDMSNIITNLLKLTFSQSNQFHLEITDSWNGASAQPITTTETIQGIFASRQLLKQGGALVWENLLNIGVEGNTPIEDWVNNTDTGINPFMWDNIEKRWRVTGISDGINSNQLEFIKTLPVDTWNFEIDYSAASTSGGDGFLTIGTRVDGAHLASLTLIADGVRQVANISITNLAAAASFGIYTRATASQGTGINFNVWGLTIASNQLSGKLLTKFDNPIIWRDWKRTVSFLMDSNYTSRTGLTTARASGINTDINKDNIDTGGVNYTDDIKINDIDLQDNPTLLADASYKGIQVKSGSSVNHLSNALFYKVENECKNSIMVEWLNSLGGIDQHLFSVSNIFENEVDEGFVGERMISDNIENVPFTKFRSSFISTQRVTLIAEKITKDQLIALREIKKSQVIRVYLTKDGSEFIYVIAVNDFVTPYNNKGYLHDFSLTLEFPNNFDFEDAKKY